MAGILSVTATRSVLMLPHDDDWFCRDTLNSLRVTRKRLVFYEKSGATAIAVKPQRKKTNIQARATLERDGADANSFQIKTPQHAEIMVAP